MASAHEPPSSVGPLHRALEAAVSTARAAWPSLSHALSDEEFRAYIHARLSADDPLAHATRVHAADLFLAAACVKADRAALATIERLHFAELPARIAAACPSKALAEDATQVLRERLLVARDDRPPGIADYTGRGALRGWLRVAAVRTAVSLRRADHDERHDDEDAALQSPAVDPEIALIQARCGDVFKVAFSAALASLSSAERATLRLHFVDHMNLDKLASVLGVSRATAGRRVFAARESLLAATLRELGERLHATPTEVESVLAIVRSKLDVSVGALVRSAC